MERGVSVGRAVPPEAQLELKSEPKRERDVSGKEDGEAPQGGAGRSAPVHQPPDVARIPNRTFSEGKREREARKEKSLHHLSTAEMTVPNWWPQKSSGAAFGLVSWPKRCV